MMVELGIRNLELGLTVLPGEIFFDFYFFMLELFGYILLVVLVRQFGGV